MADENAVTATMVDPDETLLGDGVYASFDNQKIWLRTGDGESAQKVGLAGAVYFTLVKYANDIIKQNMAKTPNTNTDLKFSVSESDAPYLAAIAGRFNQIAAAKGLQANIELVFRDLGIVSSNIYPLDFKAFSAAADDVLFDSVLAIAGNLDRAAGSFKDGFVPPFIKAADTASDETTPVITQEAQVSEKQDA